MSYAVVNLFYDKETTLIVGLCLGGGVALAQWLVMRRYVKISVWWIVACAIGIGLPIIVATVRLELDADQILIVKNEILNDVLGMTLELLSGGLISGVLQMGMVRSFSKEFGWWIAVSAVAWGVSGLGVIFGGIILALITGMALLRFFDFPVGEDGVSTT